MKELKLQRIISNPGEMLNYILSLAEDYNEQYGLETIMRGIILDQNYYISATEDGEYISIDNQHYNLAQYRHK